MLFSWYSSISSVRAIFLSFGLCLCTVQALFLLVAHFSGYAPRTLLEILSDYRHLSYFLHPASFRTRAHHHPAYLHQSLDTFFLPVLILPVIPIPLLVLTGTGTGSGNTTGVAFILLRIQRCCISQRAGYGQCSQFCMFYPYASNNPAGIFLLLFSS